MYGHNNQAEHPVNPLFSVPYGHYPPQEPSAYYNTAPPLAYAQPTGGYFPPSSSFGPPAAAAGQAPMRVSAAMAEKVSFDTSGKDPEAVKARLMIGNLNTANCTRQEVIELCRPFGTVKGLSMFRGYCFVQFANEQEAQLATSGLKNYNFHGSKLDTRPATVGRATVMNSNVSAPIKRPRYDFLFGGQRIRVETAVSRNRAFAQEVFEALKDVNFHDHGKEDTLICGSCRSVYPTMRAYVEHRRMKKCPFFEREVAPSSISCFTCREEFHEPWEFVQHLIHRHSINLYRGQPESDPVRYAQEIAEKKKQEAAQANGEAKDPAASEQTEGEKTAERNGATAAAAQPADPKDKPAEANGQKEDRRREEPTAHPENPPIASTAAPQSSVPTPSFSESVSAFVSSMASQPAYLPPPTAAFHQATTAYPPPQAQTTYPFVPPSVPAPVPAPSSSVYYQQPPPFHQPPGVQRPPPFQSQIVYGKGATAGQQGRQMLSEDEQMRMLMELEMDK